MAETVRHHVTGKNAIASCGNDDDDVEFKKNCESMAQRIIIQRLDIFGISSYYLDCQRKK